MKSEWRVTQNYIGGERMYAVYRQIDVNKVDHSGNREFAGGYTADREAAVAVADSLNRKEGEKGGR